MKSKKVKKFKKWLKAGKWAGLAVVVGLSSLWLSMKTYLVSVNKREEVQIAVVGTQGVKYSHDGQVRVYYWSLINKYPRGVDLHVNSKLYDLNDGKPQIVDAVEVKAGASVVTNLWDHNHVYFYGWVQPNADNTCGLGNYAHLEIKKQLAEVEANGETIESVQCWNDIETGDKPVQDYNDFLLILSYVPGGVAASPSPSPSPSAGSSPSPSASPDASASPSPSPSPSAGSSPSPSASPDPSPSPYFPPQQPNTGTPTWLTLAVMVVGVGLVMAKFALQTVR